MAVKKLMKRARAFGKNKNKKVNNIVANSEQSEKPMKKPKQKKTLIIAQEIKFARILASNDKKARAKMLKNLRSWITVRTKSSFAFTDTDFLRLWKGLFYCMWMSDKPLVQEELAESISQLVHCFVSMDASILYTKCALKTLSTEWFGIDQYRLDKFQMLARRILRQTFVMCKNQLWDSDWIVRVAKVIEEILMDPKCPLGFCFHITEIYMEELAKISEGEISEESVTELLRPFAIYLASKEDGRQIRHTMKYIFRHLIFQSDVGLDYMEKFDAWRQAGFPTGSINAMQKVEVSDEEDEDHEEEEEEEEEMIEEESKKDKKSKPLDPRAGRVDVELPQIPFDPQQIADLIQEYKFHPSSTTKTRRQIAKLVSEFSDLAEGKMPLGVQEVNIPKKKSAETNPKKAALRLFEFDNELYQDNNRKRRKKEKKQEINGISKKIDDKKKKPKLDDDSLNHPTIEPLILEESKNEETPLKVNKSMKNVKKDKQLKSLDNDDNLKAIKKSDSLHKELKTKMKKDKTKKQKNIKKTLNGDVTEKITDLVTVKTSPKKKISADLSGSWDISVTEAPPTPSPSRSTVNENNKKKTSPLLVVKGTNEIKDKSKTPEIKKVITEEFKQKLTQSLEKIQKEKVPRLHPVISKLGKEKSLFKTPEKSILLSDRNSSTKKKVTIVLQRNTAQLTSEYMRQLRLSPQIPYDANRKPPAGVLKPSPLSSPVNPFYKKL